MNSNIVETTVMLPAIEHRRSPKRFLDIPVEQEKLHSILEAARWAPSSRNEQPWRFILATKENPAEYERVFSTLNEKNREWAKQASVLLVAIAHQFIERTGSPNTHAMHDVGGAIAHLTTQAVSLGLQVHQMGGFDSEKLRKLYQIPEGFDPVTVNAIGYGDEETFLQHVRTRKELNSLVYEGEWGTPAGIAG